MNHISVLISVYCKEKPDNLRQSLDSIFSQTMPPNEVVLVEDGPLTEALDEIIAIYSKQHQELHVVKLPENVGLGLALKEGLKQCRNNLVARMDSDDISKPERLEKEFAYMEQHPETDVVGSWTDEFSENITQLITTRKVPETHEQLVSFSKKRNPMKHPTVMFRKKSVENAGSYQDCPLFEDYDLWIRMIHKNARFHNLQEPLLYFRLSKDFYNRRGGWNYIIKELNFQRSLHKNGHISLVTMMMNIVIRAILRMLPNNWRQKGYYFLLRR